MAESLRKVNITNISKTNPLIIISILLLINFMLRIFIWSNTELFGFADYAAYLGSVEKLARGEHQYLLEGNFLFAISYIGFFAENFLGSLDYFFVFNCLVGSLTGLILYLLITKVTRMPLAGIISVAFQTIYTEYMVFSSVFYTPVIMIFLLSLFILLIYYIMTRQNRINLIFFVAALTVVFLGTFFFKPELKFLPVLLIILSFAFYKKRRVIFYKLCGLGLLLMFGYQLFNLSGVISYPEGNTISNSFVFFGHTDYGGDGGEGAFIYPENKERYEESFNGYCSQNNISQPAISDYNAFQRQEIYKFVTQHPMKWISLQFTKFFRTFGVVPESTSFKILYTGLLKKNLFITVFIVVVPVAIIILLFIIFFNVKVIKNIITINQFKFLDPRILGPQDHKTTGPRDHSTIPFIYVYFLLFIYYIIATIFYGQYQERYRMPVMVLFIIPALGYFIVKFEKKQFLKKTSLIIKGAVILLFLTVWTFQVKKTLSNKQRLYNVIESVGGNVSHCKVKVQ